MKIKNAKTKEKVKEIYYFLARIFCDDAKKYNEHYYDLTNRYEEMINQFDDDNELLLYIEDNNEIVGALTGKNMNLDEKKITGGALGVSENYRGKGYAKALMLEFEKRCFDKGINYISLGARFRATPLYANLNYKYSLFVQISDFATLEDIRNKNIFNLEEVESFKTDSYGYIFYKVNEIDKKYIDQFEENVATCHAQYVFSKTLEK